MRTIIIRIILILAAAGVIAFGVYLYLDGQTKYNDGYVTGNTAGNLYNGGIFCESNGTVFFANPDDKLRLYSMNPEGGNLKKLSNDTALYLNADDHYVYYVRNNEVGINFDFFAFNRNSLCRINRDGSHVTVLDDKPCLYASLVGNKIYYLRYDDDTATSLYSVGIDGKDKKKLGPYIFTCDVLGSRIYYGGSEDSGSLFAFDTTTDTSSVVYECNCYKPIAYSDTSFYYMDAARDNALTYLNLNNGTPVALSGDSVDHFNLYGSTIFYQRYDPVNGNALCRIDTAGGNPEVLFSGNYMYLNTTSYYLYFMDYATKEIYYTPANNPGQLETFHPGSQS